MVTVAAVRIERGEKTLSRLKMAAGAAVLCVLWFVFVNVAPRQYAALKSPGAEMEAHATLRDIYRREGLEGVARFCRTPSSYWGVWFACRAERGRSNTGVEEWVDVYVYSRAATAQEAASVINRKIDYGTRADVALQGLSTEDVPAGIDSEELELGSLDDRGVVAQE